MKRIRIVLDFVVSLDEDGRGLPKAIADGPQGQRYRDAIEAAADRLGIGEGRVEPGGRYRFGVIKPLAPKRPRSPKRGGAT